MHLTDTWTDFSATLPAHWTTLTITLVVIGVIVLAAAIITVIAVYNATDEGNQYREVVAILSICVSGLSLLAIFLPWWNVSMNAQYHIHARTAIVNSVEEGTLKIEPNAQEKAEGKTVLQFSADSEELAQLTKGDHIIIDADDNDQAEIIRVPKNPKSLDTTEVLDEFAHRTDERRHNKGSSAMPTETVSHRAEGDPEATTWHVEAPTPTDEDSTANENDD